MQVSALVDTLPVLCVAARPLPSSDLNEKLKNESGVARVLDKKTGVTLAV
jgi:hypothetical protein